MSFTETYAQPQRFDSFQFFVTGGADGAISENAFLGKIWKLRELRVHCSSVFASVEDLVLQISSIKGSEYNLKFLSQAMNGVYDLLWQADQDVILLSDDSVNVAVSLVSAVNVLGITVVGWAVRG